MEEKELTQRLMKKQPLRYKLLIMINKNLIHEIYRMAYIDCYHKIDKKQDLSTFYLLSWKKLNKTEQNYR